MVLSQALELFLKDRRLLYCSNRTIQDYKDFIGLFIRFVEDPEVYELKLGDIREYNEYLVLKNVSKATVATYLRSIKVFIRFMEDNDILPEGRLAKRIKIPRTPKRVIQLFTPEEMSKIFDAVDTESPWISARNKLIIALMYDSGLRQGEIPKLMYKDIDFRKKVMLIHGKGDKERLVPYGKVTDKFLQEYLKLCPYKDRPWLICGRRGEEATQNGIKKMMLKLANETGLPELSSHKLRHNFATNWCIEGYLRDGYVDNIKLAVIMGHEDIHTTQRYMHEAQSVVSTTHFRSHLDGIMPDERRKRFDESYSWVRNEDAEEEFEVKLSKESRNDDF